jgi:thiamine-phosphate pyrophosphorylase
MSWSKKRLKQSKLYLILDAQVLSYKELLSQLKAGVRGGVDIVQLRSKNGSARDILDFCKEARKITAKKALFIVNDRIDLAILTKADGVHLGQDDISYKDARRMMGKKAIIGVSCQQMEQAKLAQRQGADYIGFGSIFKTQTKPERQPMQLDLLKEVVQTIKIPVFPIGGISVKNLNQITSLGVKRIAVCRDILLAKDASKAVKELKNILVGAG